MKTNELAQMRQNDAEQKERSQTIRHGRKDCACCSRGFFLPHTGKKKSETTEERIERLRKAMKEAAARLDFIEAAQLRDELLALEKRNEAKTL